MAEYMVVEEVAENVLASPISLADTHYELRPILHPTATPTMHGARESLNARLYAGLTIALLIYARNKGWVDTKNSEEEMFEKEIETVDRVTKPYGKRF
ncbi:hypothetical protein COLO4_16856 [Corchorus olitorius]|uniref:Uncharacterized protein n=1 Tax=Corchorus olitorius TaxID=93759 RepID=A0A1R3JF18_9ROSI|nr:hypothetical protein COLO4_16856 [Corchorus olitorius]